MIEEKSMSDVIKNYITDRKNGKEVSLLKDKPKKSGKGGINIKLTKVIKSSSSHDEKKLKEIIDAKKLKEQTELSFQQDKFNKLKLLAKELFSDTSDIKEYQASLQKIKDEYDFNTWINTECKNADKVSIATHIAKLTHSSNKGSCFYDRSQSINNKYLTTAHIKKPILDGSYESAKYAPITSFLLLKNGVFLYEMLLKNDYSALEVFSNNNQQLSDWVENLKKALDKPIKKSHNLSKQIFFPIKESAINDEDYHRLSVLVSSSLSHEIFKRTSSKEVNKFNKKIREKFKNKEKYSPEKIVYYPKKAILKITSSRHQNSSILNGKRRGRMFLLNSQPSIWESTVKLPVNRKQLFYGEFQYQVKDITKELRNLIVAVKLNKISLNKPQNWNKLVELTNNIIDKLFDYVSLINKLDKKDDWLKNTRLKPSHQIWLDPHKEEFEKMKQTTDWQKEICEDFASWLVNDALKHRKLKLGQAQIEVFKDIFKPELREFNAVVEAK